ncbi:MAG: PAS domain-containing protein [Oscillospiraceae bacterium]|nr:PAS domain-containing protein [Oscillospiraceae bacterium]
MKNKIIQNNLISCVAAVVLTAVVCIMTYSSYMASAMSMQAENQAYVIKEILQNHTENPVAALKDIEDSFKNRVTLVDNNGKVLYDSVHDELTLENHLEREEIVQAIETGKGRGKRYSETDRANNYYCAISVDGTGVIRVGVKSSAFFTDAILTNLPVIVLVLLAVLAMIYAISIKTTRRIVNTIENFNFDAGDNSSFEELSPFIDKIEAQKADLIRQGQKTSAEKDKLQSIFSNMAESIIVCDRKKMVVQHNRQAGNIFGVAEGARLFEIIRDENLNSALDMVLDGQKARGVLAHGKATYQYTISPNIQNGEITGSIIIFLDITQQVESQKMRRQFTANVTHELKTPLTSILGYSQLISSGIARQEDVNSFAGIIEKNAQQLLTLIEDIMQISALEENGVEDMAEISLKAVTDEIVRDLQPVIDEKQLSLTYNAGNVVITANYKQMGDLFRNLISNAIKYNKAGGKVDVNLCYSADGKNAVFTVADTGIGIAPHHREKVFQRFYVVDKSRNKSISSTGLGLSIVKHIVTAMGGTIDLDSELGKGSKFTVTLPVKQK